MSGFRLAEMLFISWTSDNLFDYLCGPEKQKRSQTLRVQGQEWFRGIVELSKVQVKDDITRAIKDVELGFIVFGTPRSESQNQYNHNVLWPPPWKEVLRFLYVKDSMKHI